MYLSILPIVFGLALVTSIFLTPLVRSLAKKWEIYDHPDLVRKVHATAVPYLGGVAIILSFCVALVFILALQAHVGTLFEGPGIAVIISFLIIIGAGLYDDLRGLSHKKKFIAQFGVANLLVFSGLRVDLLQFGFFPEYELLVTGLSMIISVLWIVGITNAMNLIDGKDGLAAGTAALAMLAMGAAFAFLGHSGLWLVALALVGAILGFLVYNFNPASIFMGDTGSLFLGLAVAIFGLRGTQIAMDPVILLVPVLALGFPILDTSLSIFRRLIRNKSLFSPDRDHIHHRLSDIFAGSHRQTVVVLYGLTSIFGLNAILLALNPSAGLIGLLISFLTAFMLLRKLGYVHLRKTIKLFLQSYGFLPQDPQRQEDEAGYATSRSVYEAPSLIVNPHVLLFAGGKGLNGEQTAELAMWRSYGIHPVMALSAHVPADDVASLVTATDGSADTLADVVTYEDRHKRSYERPEVEPLHLKFDRVKDLVTSVQALEYKTDFIFVDFSDRANVYAAATVSWLWSRPYVLDLKDGWRANMNKKARLLLSHAPLALVYSQEDYHAVLKLIRDPERVFFARSASEALSHVADFVQQGNVRQPLGDLHFA